MGTQPQHLLGDHLREEDWKIERFKRSNTCPETSPRNDRKTSSMILNKTQTRTTLMHMLMWKGDISWAPTHRQRNVSN